MSPPPRTRPVAVWLLAVAAAVVVQVLLGGVTRLTDSGLSITEWKPLLGVIPPLDDAGWADAFGKYQQIPQYQKLKSHLTLDAFKVIYFWEWFHRLWGRLLGVAFAVPLAVFWRQGRLAGLKKRLVGLLLLGGLQGVLGWVMVMSGLQELVYVSHLRLAAHLLLAVVLLAAVTWTGLELLLVPSPQPALFRATAALLAALAAQLTLGAFMAGLKAAVAAPSWPTLNGLWFPSTLFDDVAWWNDPLDIHFFHRGLAYLLVLGTAWWWWAGRRAFGPERHGALALVALQTALGALTAVHSPYPGRLLWFGATHQLVAMLLVMCFVMAAVRCRRRQPSD